MHKHQAFVFALVVTAVGCDGGTGPGDTGGDLRVYVTTVGLGVDPDGYTLILDGADSKQTTMTGIYNFSALTPGGHTLALSGLADNCASSDSPAEVTVAADSTTQFRISVLCIAPISDDVEIAFVRSVGSHQYIYGMRADGNGVVDITGHPSWDPAWSPDGSRLAFTTFYADTLGEIYVFNADGKGLRQITKARERHRFPAWSPDGKQLVFWSSQGSDLYIVDLATGVSHNFTSTPNIGEFEPSWSPDGVRIAFTRYSAECCGADLFARDVNNGGETAITRDSSPHIQNQKPRWSPDGSTVVFEREILGSPSRSEIWLVGADGSSARALVAGEGARGSPEWSPDGASIIFHVSGPGAQTGTYLVNRDGTGLRQLTTAGTGSARWRRRPS